jgi:hypothetical protein
VNNPTGNMKFRWWVLIVQINRSQTAAESELKEWEMPILGGEVPLFASEADLKDSLI